MAAAPERYEPGLFVNDREHFFPVGNLLRLDDPGAELVPGNDRRIGMDQTVRQVDAGMHQLLECAEPVCAEQDIEFVGAVGRGGRAEVHIGDPGPGIFADTAQEPAQGGDPFRIVYIGGVDLRDIDDIAYAILDGIRSGCCLRRRLDESKRGKACDDQFPHRSFLSDLQRYKKIRVERKYYKKCILHRPHTRECLAAIITPD